MKTFSLIFLCLALAGLALGDSVVGPGCSVSVATTARSGGSFQSGSGVSQIYDIVITNTGRCSADNIAINIGLASGTIAEKWNLESGTRYYTVTNFGATLPVGNSVNTGIVVNYPNTQTVPQDAVSTTVYGTLCPSECVNAQATANTATTSSVPSSTTGQAPATSGSGSSSESGSQNESSENGDGSCTASVTLTARNGGSFQTGSGMSQIYDAAITNSGSCGLTNIALQLALPAGSAITSSWNLESNGNLRYTVNSYEGLLPVGSTVNAGFIVNFPNTQTIPSGVAASISSTSCPDSCSGSGSGSGSGTGSGSVTSATGAVTSSVPGTTGNGQPAGCEVSTTTTARSSGSFQSGSGVSQIYDVVVTNSGSCGVNNIVLNAALPAGSAIQSTWNLQANGGTSYTVTSYEGTLPAGNSVNVGFIVNFPNTQTVPAGVSASATTTTCNECARRR